MKPTTMIVEQRRNHFVKQERKFMIGGVETDPNQLDCLEFFVIHNFSTTSLGFNRR